MHSPFAQQFSWIALAAAVALWVCVGYFVWTTFSASSERLSKLAATDQEVTKYTDVLRLRTLARETQDARARLEGAVSADVVEIIDSVDALAQDVGIPIKVGQALSSSDISSPVHAATSVEEGAGSFAQVLHAVALLESLPIPSFLEELYLELLPAAPGKKSLWHLVARIRFLTTSDISS